MLRNTLLTTLFLLIGLFELVHIVSFAEEIPNGAMMESGVLLNDVNHGIFGMFQEFALPRKILQVGH